MCVSFRHQVSSVSSTSVEVSGEVRYKKHDMSCHVFGIMSAKVEVVVNQTEAIIIIIIKYLN